MERERERRKIVTNKQAATVTRKTFPNNMTNFTRIGIETINLIFRGAYWHRQRWPYVNHEMLCFLFSTFSFFCPFSLVFFLFRCWRVVYMCITHTRTGRCYIRHIKLKFIVAATYWFALYYEMCSERVSFAPKKAIRKFQWVSVCVWA